MSLSVGQRLLLAGVAFGAVLLFTQDKHLAFASAVIVCMTSSGS